MIDGTNTAEATTPDTLVVRMLRRTTLEGAGQHPMSGFGLVRAGEACGLSPDEARRLVLLGWCEPVGWTLEGEERKGTARRLLAELEELRYQLGFNPEAMLSRPLYREMYERIEATLVTP